MILITETASLCKTNDTFQVAYTNNYTSTKTKRTVFLEQATETWAKQAFSTYLLIVYMKLSLTKATAK